ncbi:hypothetical protein, partial [Streptomyces sp. NPDC010273]|uniref:hypothetical protein n=1 Tax=Streptomyces sp. NPDC010273 TaxID=3364829 RepID=UPI0036E85CE4
GQPSEAHPSPVPRRPRQLSGARPEPGTASVVGRLFRVARHRPVPVTASAAVGHRPRRADPTP